jgi:hypothetical protein
MRVGDLVEYLKNLNPNTDLKITQLNGGLTTWIKIVPYGNDEVWLTPFSEEPDLSWYDYDRCCPGACNGDFNE